MTDSQGDRSVHFPKIEAKHGKPIKHWFALLSKLGDAKYADQIALLKDKHGFSQAHANAVVMHHRGSTSTRKYSSAEDLFSSLGENQAKLSRQIFSVIQKKYPKLELVVAWNQPMLKIGKHYVIGVSSSKNHLTIGPWGDDVIHVFSQKLEGLETNKKTIKVPLDWKVDKRLLCDLVQYRLDELDEL